MIGNAEISYYRKLAADAAAEEEAAALYNAGYKAGRAANDRIYAPHTLSWAGQLEWAAADVERIAREMESRLEDMAADGGGEFGGGEFDELTAALAAVKTAAAALGNGEYHADNAADLADRKRGEPC